MNTHSKCAALFAAGLLAATGAVAQTSPWTVRLGAAHVGFSAQADVLVNGTLVPGADARASSNTTLGLEVSYDFTPRWTGRLLVGVPPTTTLTGTGTLAGTGTLGKVQYGPAVLSMTYNLLTSGPIRPYVGAGVNYTIVFKSKDGFISNLDVKNAFGAVAQVGVEIPLEDDWSISLDARKIFLKTKASGSLLAMGGAAANANVRLNPLVVFASVNKRF
ncbi:Outer membrane protein W precursor [Hydrogenophaga sp. T4]|jgi:outer membrane protein|nr:Outer membrane protein W precursor [Hydrogenophaga sp. T4]